MLGPAYEGSLDVDAADVTVDTPLVISVIVLAVVVDFESAADVVADGDIDVAEDCTDFDTVCRFITISVGMSTVMGETVVAALLALVVVSAGTGSKQTSSSVVPDDVCRPARSFKSIQLAPTLSVSVSGKLRTRVSFSSTM